ncbi:ATP-binding protein [Nocardiopsis flavescens]|uniref:ATP-binding protein n=1 Tax=Nocardiopsis flavescens TaxID=758803 RepID=UPI0036639AF5
MKATLTAPAPLDPPHEPGAVGQTHKLTIGSALTEIGYARAWVSALPLDLAEEMLDRLRLVLSETVTNALVHTASGQSGGTTVIEIAALRCRPSSVELRVTDAGARRGQGLLSFPRQMTPTDDQTSGRGLSLVAAESDHWTWTGSPHDGATVLAVFRPR